ncbi:MAG: hypothetical protein ABI548_27640 [Polyangiaceae bacterium]
MTTLPHKCPPQGPVVAPAAPPEPALELGDTSVPEQAGSVAADASAPDAKDKSR